MFVVIIIITTVIIAIIIAFPNPQKPAQPPKVIRNATERTRAPSFPRAASVQPAFVLWPSCKKWHNGRNHNFDSSNNLNHTSNSDSNGNNNTDSDNCNHNLQQESWNMKVLMAPAGLL